MKYFSYYGCDFSIGHTNSYGHYEIEGLSGKYRNYKLVTTDSTLYDDCDSDNRKDRMLARRSSYHLIRDMYEFLN